MTSSAGSTTGLSVVDGVVVGVVVGVVDVVVGVVGVVVGVVVSSTGTHFEGHSSIDVMPMHFNTTSCRISLQ